MKHLIQKILNAINYEFRKLPAKKQQILLYTDLYSEDSLNNKRLYNIGAGGFSHPYWTNVDYDSEWYSSNRIKTLKGINYDLFLLEALSIDNDSAEVVYSSHTVEHINNAELKIYLTKLIEYSNQTAFLE